MKIKTGGEGSLIIQVKTSGVNGLAQAVCRLKRDLKINSNVSHRNCAKMPGNSSA